jgi:hypothetical protein
MTGEQAELWGSQKRDRLATLLQQIVEMDDRLQSGELTLAKKSGSGLRCSKRSIK